MNIGLQASHEQFSPRTLLRLARQAEQSGFATILSSDHITPWSHSQDNSGFVWAWLGAAMEATKNVTFSTVSVPGYRYHPVVLAQAIATLCHLYPGRFFPCLGSGEALNEHVTGQPWPQKTIRNKILQESVEVMRRLWRGETVTHHGAITVDESTLYTLPDTLPQVFGAALTTETAAWLGKWADGLVTVADDIPSLQARLQAFAENGGEDKPVIVKMDFSYAHTRRDALEGAYRQWRFLLLPPEQLATLRRPQDLEKAAVFSKADIETKIPLYTRSEEVHDTIRTYADLGVDTLILHNVNTNQEQFVQDISVWAYNSKDAPVH